MLGTLLVLVAGAAGLAVTHLAASWVIAPPAAMLGGFLVLLREAAHTDAEHASRATRAGRTITHETGYATPAGGGLHTRATAGDVAPAKDALPVTASWPESTAQVIELSGRVHDQLYDQYSDAAERAVGD